MKFELLFAHPAFWLTVTIVCYLLAQQFYRVCHHHALAHPLLMTVLVLIGLLKLTHTDYALYAARTQAISMLLGPATVALAVPLYAQLGLVKRIWRPLLIALALGSVTGVVSVIVLSQLFGLPHDILVSFAPKSVTTPIAMALAEKQGGYAALAAAAVLVAGLAGVAFGQSLLRALGVQNDAVQGFALGLASHGGGTSRAFHISQQAGAFASLGMSLNGLFTSLWLPLLLVLWPV